MLRFWKRRWWRTLPAYYVALGMSWLAVFATRGEPFELRYLVFLQNYMAEMPFFLVSWSLCIEEHFYLVVPMAPVFGFERTATHLRIEGLLLGFALSAIFVLRSEHIARVQHAARWAVGPLIVLAAWSVGSSDARLSYVLASTCVALALSAALVAGVGSTRSARGPLRHCVAWVALISYSIYLTHALVIHVALRIHERVQTGLVGYFVITTLLIGAMGTIFYLTVERFSLWLRERFVPRGGEMGR